MKAYIDDAHRRGFKVKIYDTVRELSNRAPGALRPAQPRPRDLHAGAGRRLFLAPGAPRGRLHRRLVRARAQGRRGHQQRHVALAQLLHRGPRLGGQERRHRRPLPRRRRLRPDDHEAGPQGPRPQPAGGPHRPPQRQPVQRPRRLRLERQPLPRAFPLSSTASGSASISTTTGAARTTGWSRCRACRSGSWARCSRTAATPGAAWSSA